MKKLFEQLKLHFGSYKASAKFIGVSYSRYNEWRADPDAMPLHAKRLVELAIESLKE